MCVKTSLILPVIVSIRFPTSRWGEEAKAMFCHSQLQSTPFIVDTVGNLGVSVLFSEIP